MTGGATVAIARTATFLWRKQTFPEDVATAFPSRRDKSEVRDVMLIQSLPEKMAWRGLFRYTDSEPHYFLTNTTSDQLVHTPNVAWRAWKLHLTSCHMYAIHD